MYSLGIWHPPKSMVANLSMEIPKGWSPEISDFSLSSRPISSKQYYSKIYLMKIIRTLRRPTCVKDSFWLQIWPRIRIKVKFWKPIFLDPACVPSAALIVCEISLQICPYLQPWAPTDLMTIFGTSVLIYHLESRWRFSPISLGLSCY